MRTAVVAVGLLACVAALAGLGGRATPGAQVTADEPQYLLTADALVHGEGLDIGPALRAERWRTFHHDQLPVQTKALPGGRRLSPHDPGLPVLLAVPYALGGWAGAKVAMALVAGLVAALSVWVAVVRFGVPTRVAAVVVSGASIVPPLVAYGTQLYPELPGALVVLVAVAALTGRPGRRTTLAWVAALVVLPWFSVKYLPVGAALAAIGVLDLWRAGARRALAVALAVLAVAGVAYLVVHQHVYGGWTVYAAGNHFADGEATVMGRSPDYGARTVRLVNLLVDRDFGLAAWAPAYLAGVPAFAALARRRPPGWAALALPVAVGWANATWIALTMHGWWWPGRQLVVVLPLLVIALAWWCGTVLRWDRARSVFLAATAFGVLAWTWLQVEVARGTRSVIWDFDGTTNPLGRAWRALLPDGRRWGAVDQVLLAAWTVALAAGAAWAWRDAGRLRGGDEDAGAGERADADVAAVDLDRGGAVG